MLEEDFKLVKNAMHISPDLIPAIGALDRIKKALDESAKQIDNIKSVLCKHETIVHSNPVEG